MSNPVISRDPEVMGGTPVFSGTRVPVRMLTDHLLEGYTLNYFLDHYPTVSREQAEGFLDLAKSTTEDMQGHPLINKNPRILGGTPVFMGTRVPIAILTGHLMSNYTLNYFLDGFPSVSREQAEGFLELVRETLAAEEEPEK